MSAAQNSPPNDLITVYVLELLRSIGLGDLTEDQKKRYVPAFSRRVEERIGLELLPKLTDEQFKEFTRLAGSGTTTRAQWEEFWRRSIPDFEEEIKIILADFAADARQTTAWAA
ncbi:MAG: hypothetical protein UY92_C0013G0033 [Candidatus Magasanikbacteria bacterium GW2011_GWA2_56_11]|uniref:Uncharacterized protein n=1 Tax=Candidatus Magasanikbacteria bacterium GW2011_GWA2_56_11 TaxID=1619044 RepID=A0A0G2B8Q1_9BACT|nr:MAG: hypothetical protein UY92_C0013G0033 [Candidatus Magasanikbacteria bacterium GW2011_GWA2_56_11]